MSRAFKDKWTSAIEKHGHTDVPNILLQNLGKLHITAPEFLTLTAILSFKWDEKSPFPSIEAISKRTNSTPRNIKKHVSALEKKQLLRRVPRKRQSNLYDFANLRFELDKLSKIAIPPGQNKSLKHVEINPSTVSILTSEEDSVEEDSLRKRTNKSAVSDDTDELASQVRLVYEHFIKQFDKNPNSFKLTNRRKLKLKARLKDAGYEVLVRAIDNVASNEWYMGCNDRNWKADLDYITRSYEQVERLSQLNDKTLSRKEDW